MRKRFSYVLDRGSKVLLYIGMICIVALMVIIVLDLILRNAFNSHLAGSYELIQLLLALAAFLSLAYIQVVKGHIFVDIVISRLPARSQVIVEGAGLILMAAVFGIISYVEFSQGLYLKEAKEITDELQLATFPFRLSCAIGSLALCVVALSQATQCFLRSKR